MSAWVVEREHIDVMIRKALGSRYGLNWRSSEDGEPTEYRAISLSNASEVGRMLAEENVASVCARYEDDTADLYAELLNYTYRDPGYVMTAGETFQAVGCYEYESCEHDGWESSEAKRFCEALTADAQAELYSGPWGWDKAALEAAKLGKSAAMLEP